jgi:hypothetical protein
MRIIFLHPEAERIAESGSALRPKKMREAFEKRGYEVFAIVGDRSARRKLYDKLKQCIEDGLRFDYLYVESLSRPTNTRIVEYGPLKLIKKEQLDFDVIRFCLDNGIKTGFFLRDIYWDFSKDSFFGSGLKSFYLSRVLRFFGKRELNFLKSNDIHLFCPSQQFLYHLSSKYDLRGNVLRPGMVKMNSEKRVLESPLRLLYVGGCMGVYDPTVFLNGITEAENVQMTFCTRAFEWKEFRENKQYNNLNVVHKSGEELRPLYSNAHIAVYSPPPKDYIRLAFGVKLMEYVANGLPIIGYKGTEAARFIEENNIGWTIDYSEDAVKKILFQISQSPEDYREKQLNVLNKQDEFTWQGVIDKLEKSMHS